MASVGTLAAGVAHEINNPLAYVSSNLTFLEEQLAQDDAAARGSCPSCARCWPETQEGAGRVRAIVQDLKSFARADEERRGPVDVHRVVDGALRLVRNELRHRRPAGARAAAGAAACWATRRGWGRCSSTCW